MTIAEVATRGMVGVDMRPVASYGRISKKTKGDGGGAFIKIEKQHEDNTAYIHAHFPGAPIAYYEDNMSAWDPEVTRPDWERMLTDIRNGNLRAAVAWHADRYTRQPAQLEILWDVLKTSRAQYHTVRGGQVTNPLMLRIEGALSANDSDLKSEKISRAFLTAAENGKPHGGRRRLGYKKGMMELEEKESDALREVCKRFIGGESLYSLAKWLDEKGITGTGGAKITGPNLRNSIMSPHLAGLRSHTVDGVTTLYPGQWPAIITREDHEAIVFRLSDKGRKTSTGNARVHLLSGVMTCDACGKPLRGRPLYRQDGRAYACATGRHCHRPIHLVDATVRAIVVEKLSRLDAAGVFVNTDAAERVARLELDREALIARREAAEGRWSDGLVDDDRHDRNMAVLDKKEREIVAALGEARMQVRPVPELEGMTGPEAEARWDAAPLDRQRTVLRCLFESLSLVGAQHGREPFTPQHVRYVWRDVPGAA